MATPSHPRPARPEIEFPTDVAPLEPPASFLDRAASFGLGFEAGELRRLGLFLALMRAANDLVNLTSITDADAAWERHVFDALTLVPLLQDLPPGARVADVGSGGGVPGLPLAIALPDHRFTLIEATGKKAAFLRSAAGALGLAGVDVENERAETLGQRDGRRDAFDAVVARAVGPLAVVAELCVPLAKVGGLTLLIKGERADEELGAGRAALHLLHAAHAGTVETPTGRVIVLEKTRPTPRAYPRRSGEPKRAPLS